MLYPEIVCSNVQHNTEQLGALAHLLNVISPAILRHLYEFSCPVLLSRSEAPDILSYVFGGRGSMSDSVSILGAFRKIAKSAISFIVSVCLSVCLSVRMEHLGSHWTDFNEI